MVTDRWRDLDEKNGTTTEAGCASFETQAPRISMSQMSFNGVDDRNTPAQIRTAQ